MVPAPVSRPPASTLTVASSVSGTFSVAPPNTVAPPAKVWTPVTVQFPLCTLSSSKLTEFPNVPIPARLTVSVPAPPSMCRRCSIPSDVQRVVAGAHVDCEPIPAGDRAGIGDHVVEVADQLDAKSVEALDRAGIGDGGDTDAAAAGAVVDQDTVVGSADDCAGRIMDRAAAHRDAFTRVRQPAAVDAAGAGAFDDTVVGDSADQVDVDAVAVAVLRAGAGAGARDPPIIDHGAAAVGADPRAVVPDDRRARLIGHVHVHGGRDPMTESGNRSAGLVDDGRGARLQVDAVVAAADVADEVPLEVISPKFVTRAACPGRMPSLASPRITPEAKLVIVTLAAVEAMASKSSPWPPPVETMVPELLIAIVLVPTLESMRNASLTEVMRAPALLLSVKLRTVEPPEVSSARTVALIVPKLLMMTPGAGEGPLHVIAVPVTFRVPPP